MLVINMYGLIIICVHMYICMFLVLTIETQNNHILYFSNALKKKSSVQTTRL
jgi:hypothetical protein